MVYKVIQRELCSNNGPVDTVRIAHEDPGEADQVFVFPLFK